MGRKLYYNGDIITMEDALYAEALLEENGRIAAVGRIEDWMKEDAELIDLKGCTLMPAFLDAHSHFSGYAMSMIQVPLDEAYSFEDIKERIQQFIKENGVKPGEWVQAKGYDHNRLREKSHPDKELLDEAAPDNPLVIQHQSGHMGVFNTEGLKALAVDENTECPAGGMFGRKDGKLNGYMEEAAFVQYLQKLPMPSMEKLAQAFIKVQDSYASYGITTVQEGLMMEQMAGLYEYLIQKEMLKLDVTAYLDVRKPDGLLAEFKDYFGKYRGHFKIGGYKVMLDGSPQGRTAWMKEPYRSGEEGYKGYPVYTDEELEQIVQRAYREGRQLLAHCNGDAASQQYIDAYEKAVESVKEKKEIRPVIIHAQLMDEGQIEKAASLSMIASFFIAHIWHWGDTHIQNFGKQRADKISMARTALDKGLCFTFHQDSPVIKPDMFETIWCAVNRITREGEVLGGEERIDVLDALKAVTINAAYQYFEEEEKGSLRPGKSADLIILDKNPLKADKSEIRYIRVLETIKEGKSIWKHSI